MRYACSRIFAHISEESLTPPAFSAFFSLPPALFPRPPISITNDRIFLLSFRKVCGPHFPANLRILLQNCISHLIPHTLAFPACFPHIMFLRLLINRRFFSLAFYARKMRPRKERDRRKGSISFIYCSKSVCHDTDMNAMFSCFFSGTGRLGMFFNTIKFRYFLKHVFSPKDKNNNKFKSDCGSEFWRSIFPENLFNFHRSINIQ